jgi:hypothetical protein
MTPDGKYVVFSSQASSYVPGASGWQVYRKNMQTGEVQLVSSLDGTGANRDQYGNSFNGQISADGRYVLFRTNYQAFVDPTGNYGNYGSKSYLKDMMTGTITLVSSLDGSIQNQFNCWAEPISLTPDARSALMNTCARNATNNSGNGNPQIVLRDLTSSGPSSIQLVSSVDGTTSKEDNSGAYSDANFPNLTPDGRYVLFYSKASNLVPGQANEFDQAYRKDLLTGEIKIVSSLDGAPGNAANSRSYPRGLSADGRYALIASRATNLRGTNNGGYWQTYRKDLQTGNLDLVSAQWNNPTLATIREAWPISISADGRYVTYYSSGADILQAGGNWNTQIYQKDFVTGNTRVISSRDGTVNQEGNNSSEQAIASPDGLYVAFRSAANNLMDGVYNWQAYLSRTSANPRVMIGAPAEQSYLSDHPIVSGTCSADDESVVLTASTSQSFSANTLCVNGLWKADLNLSSLPHGQVTLTANHQNSSGTQAESASRTYSLMTPIMQSLAITNANSNGGNLYVGSNTLNLSATIQGDYAQYCILESDSNITDCSWLNGPIPASFNVSAGDGTKSITLWTKNASGDLSGSVSSSVTVKTNPPSAPTGIQLVSPSTSPSNTVSTPTLLVQGTILNTKVYLYLDSLCKTASIGSATGADSQTQFTTRPIPPGWKQKIYAQNVDFAGNKSACSTSYVEYEYDQSGPILISSLDGTMSTADRSGNQSIPTGITPDGKYIVFHSASNSFVPGSSGWQVYRKNMQTGEIELVSSLDGTAATSDQTSSSTNGQISADGRYVLFQSSFSKFIDPNWTGGNNQQVYLKDMQTGALTLVTSRDGTLTNAGNNTSQVAALTPDGRYALISTAANNLASVSPQGGNWQVMVRDLRATGVSAFKIVSSIDGSISNEANNTSQVYANYPNITPDGRYVLFWSYANNLVTGANGNYGPQIYRKDLASGELILVSSKDGTGANESNSQSIPRGISADGRYAVFASANSNLISGATGNWQAYRKDLKTGIITFVSNRNGDASNHGNSVAWPMAVSTDGRYITFGSPATDLMPDGGNGNWQIFQKDMKSGKTYLLSSRDGTVSQEGNDTSGSSEGTVATPDGLFVAFQSAAGNLIAGASGWQIYLNRASVNPRVTITSPDAGLVLTANPILSGLCSESGQSVVIKSSAGPLAASIPCINHSFSGQIDLSSLPHGAITLTADLESVAGLAADQDSRDFQLVTPLFQSITISNSTNVNSTVYVASTTLNLTPSIQGDYNRYCILENDTNVSDCSWSSGSLPASYTLSSVTEGSKAISVWIKNSSGDIVGPSTASFTLQTTTPPVPTSLALSTPATSPSTSVYAPTIQVNGTTLNSNVSLYLDSGCSDSNRVGQAVASAGSTLITTQRLPALFQIKLYAKAVSFSGKASACSTAMVRYEYAPNSPVLLTSRDGSNTQAQTDSCGPRHGQLTPDGKYLVFQSCGNYLSSANSMGNTNSFHIWRKNLLTLKIDLVDSLDGTLYQGNCGSQFPEITPDGRFVTFSSCENLLVTNSGWQVYVKDMQTGTLTLASSNDGTALRAGNQASWANAISNDGRYVFFASSATNLIEGSMNNQFFRKDLQTGSITLLSSPDGTADNEDSGSIGTNQLSVTPDGRYIAFATFNTNMIANAPNQWQVVRKDLLTNQVALVSAPNGSSSFSNSDSSTNRHSISDDGRFVLFTSYGGPNLFPGQDWSYQWKAYLKDLSNNSLTQVSSTNGLPGGGANSDVDSGMLQLSPDARYATFRTNASNLVTGSNGSWQTYRKDLKTGSIDILSSSDGTPSTQDNTNNSYDSFITSVGRYAAFRTNATNFPAGSSTPWNEIYLRRLNTDPRVIITTPASDSILASQQAVSGYCSEEGQPVVVTLNSAQTNTTCTNSMWSVTLNFSSLSNGSVTVTADHQNDQGTPATQATRTFMIGSPTILAVNLTGSAGVISNSPTLTVSASVTGKDYAKYCILENDTNMAHCTWVTGQIPSSYSASNTDGTKTLSVWVQSATGVISNRSDSTTVTLDETAPQLASLTILNSNPTDTNIYRLSYGALSGGKFKSYCFLENDTNVNHCSFTTSMYLPANYQTTLTSSAKVLSFWLKDATGNIGSRVESNSVTYDTSIAPSLATASVSNVSPTNSRKYQLSYGAITGSYVAYCIQSNNNNAGTCSWTNGTLPGSYQVNNVQESKSLSIWLKNASGKISSRIDTSPVVYSAPHIVAVSAGNSSTSCSITDQGALDCWGHNYESQLKARNFSTPTVVPNAISDAGTQMGIGQSYSCFTSAGALYCSGANGNLSVDSTAPALRIPSGVTGLAVGNSHTCAIVNGLLQCWGYNYYGQTGNGKSFGSNVPFAKPATVFDSGVTKVAASYNNTCAIVNGALSCWGLNGNGQVGTGSSSPDVIASPYTVLQSGVTDLAIANGDSAICAVQSGALKCWGNTWGWSSATPQNRITSGVTAVAMGSSHVCAIVSGSLQCSGANWNYQLGDGTTNSINNFITVIPSGVTAVYAKSDTTCAIVNGDLKCWGVQLGDGSPASLITSPTTILSGNVTSATLGANAACAAQGGAIKCWGSNDQAQLGLGNTSTLLSPVRIITQGVSGVANGQNHTCAIVNGDLQCWGSNSYYGSVGNNNEASMVTTPTTVLSGNVTQVSAKFFHTCAIQNGALYCWGSNWLGQLGTGDRNNQGEPTLVQGMSSGVTAVSVSQNHTCAIKNGALYCWGYDEFGQVGDGQSQEAVLTPHQVFASNVTAISTNSDSTCAVVGNNVQCWGYNANYALGLGFSESIFSPTTVMAANSQTQLSGGWHGTCAVTSGVLSCWGNNSWGQLGPNTGYITPRTVTTPAPVAQVAVGQVHSCVVLTTGKTQCFGQNSEGMLGTGNTNSSFSPIDVIY